MSSDDEAIVPIKEMGNRTPNNNNLSGVRGGNTTQNFSNVYSNSIKGN